MQRLRIVVGGFIGLLPAGGVTWDYIQYPLGFSLLGHEVYYIEDTRLYPVYQKPGSDWRDCSASVEHLQKVMTHFGFKDRWAYRDEASGKSFGLSEKKIKDICAAADVFVNISCSTVLREEYFNIPVRILIDSDPMFTQVQAESQQMFTPGEPGIRNMIAGHTTHFTFGENIGEADCRIPKTAENWLPTRQPVVLNHWSSLEPPQLKTPLFTTLMNWNAGKKLLYQEEEWGQKEMEFRNVQELPGLVPGIELAIAISQTTGVTVFSKEELALFGWTLLEPDAVAADWKMYQKFIDGSTGEFSVAKHTYVKAKTGWFSCRSACYLAAARPVVVQETAWSKYIPAGKGLLAFTDAESAADALLRVTKDLKKHSSGAREIAGDFFDSNKVLKNLLQRSGL